jgi:hypothetical protein
MEGSTALCLALMIVLWPGIPGNNWKLTATKEIFLRHPGYKKFHKPPRSSVVGAVGFTNVVLLSPAREQLFSCLLSAIEIILDVSVYLANLIN